MQYRNSPTPSKRSVDNDQFDSGFRMNFIGHRTGYFDNRNGKCDPEETDEFITELKMKENRPENSSLGISFFILCLRISWKSKKKLFLRFTLQSIQIVLRISFIISTDKIIGWVGIKFYEFSN